MKITFLALLALLFISSCQQNKENTTSASISQVMDDVITRLYAEVPPAKYDSIDETFISNFISDAEKKVLATRHWNFRVNVPVTVSLMRHKDQQNVPFWLPESGFIKTSMVVENEEYTYEVWQKKYNPGIVELGINGFDKHRPVYFICVGPQNPDDALSITDIYPKDQVIDTMRIGAFTYHDWTELILTQVPPQLARHQLFTTVRGRAREAHVVGGFRKTLFPSSAKPDQIMLTWGESPENSIHIQWRTDTTIQNGTVRYWVASKTDTSIVSAGKFILQDRMLSNDRYVHRFTAHLKNLESGNKYYYQISTEQQSGWSETASFETALVPAQKFSFIWFGDTHRSPEWGKLLNDAYTRHPEAAFYSIAGDLVTTGLYRDEWDMFFQYAGKVFAYKPLMPVPGNHDRQDGLGAGMYYNLFSLPKNGPSAVAPESSYALRYGNALFLMIDATFPIEAHTEWIEKQLSTTKATWKFVMFHFPPYNFEAPYPDIQQAWVPLFDKYHVDMVMGGHIHYYMRSQPMRQGKVVDSYDKGTVYAISISTVNKHNDIGQEPYAVKRYKEGQFYQHMTVDDHTLTFKTYDTTGTLKDEFVIHK